MVGQAFIFALFLLPGDGERSIPILKGDPHVHDHHSFQCIIDDTKVWSNGICESLHYLIDSQGGSVRFLERLHQSVYDRIVTASDSGKVWSAVAEDMW
jgi:hypothetical protein